MVKFFSSLFFFIFLSTLLFAQDDSDFVGHLYSQGNVAIDLYIKKSKNPCGINAKSNRFQLDMKNVSFINSTYKYLNWKMDIVNCNGDIIAKTISVNLELFNVDGLNKSADWIFEGTEISNPFYNVSPSKFPDNAKDFVKGKSISKAARSIYGEKEVMSGEETLLSVEGGDLAKDAEWVWYEGSCDGIKLGKGVNIKVKPTTSTKYFVRAEGKNNITACVSAVVVINDNSKPALKIIGKNFICKGYNGVEKLTVFGGKLGYKAKWVWYEGECNGANKIGEGNEIKITPQKPTIYFVRAEGLTNVTDCVEFKVGITDVSETAKSISATKSICEGEMITLTVEGGRLANDAKWVWYSQEESSYNKSQIGEGATMNVTPDVNTQYFVRAEGVCNTTKDVFTSIAVTKKSIAPDYITYYQSDNSSRSYTLEVHGGELGDGATWVWYKNNCGGKKIGTGSEITYKAKKNSTVYVRAEGGCETTECASSDISAIKKVKPKFKFINAGILLGDLTNISEGTVSVGTQSIYLRAKLGIQDLIQGNEKVASTYESTNKAIINFPTNSEMYYEYNGKINIKRNSYSLGYMFGGKNLRFYLGGGYGKREVLWGADIYYYGSPSPQYSVWARNVNQSISGPEAEAGIFIKIKGFNLMGGVNAIFSTTNNSNYIDADVGIGFSF